MLTGWEWIVILGIAVVIILWGPSKIPELAKALGRAKGEFDKASKELTASAIQTSKPIETTKRSRDDVLIETAKKLGISTEGKTAEQISEEIVAKANVPSRAD